MYFSDKCLWKWWLAGGDAPWFEKMTYCTLLNDWNTDHRQTTTIQHCLSGLGIGEEWWVYVCVCVRIGVSFTSFRRSALIIYFLPHFDNLVVGISCLLNYHLSGYLWNAKMISIYYLKLLIYTRILCLRVRIVFMWFCLKGLIDLFIFLVDVWIFNKKKWRMRLFKLGITPPFY